MGEKLTQREPKILESMVHDVQAAHIAALLSSLVDPAEGTQGGIARFVGCHPARDLGLDSPFEMVAELVLEVLLDLIAAEQGAQSQAYRVEQAQQAHV